MCVPIYLFLVVEQNISERPIYSIRFDEICLFGQIFSKSFHILQRLTDHGTFDVQFIKYLKHEHHYEHIVLNTIM